MPPRRHRRRQRRNRFAVAAVFGAGLLVEGFARLVEPWATPPPAVLPEPSPAQHSAFSGAAGRAQEAMRGIEMVSDPVTGWALPVDRVFAGGGVEIRVNALGLRGPELQPRVAAEARLLCLGDSTVFGDGVTEEEAFCSVAATLLAKRWGTPVTGVIGGVPGHDSSQSLARLNEKGLVIEPTWVIVGNIWSDVYHDRGHLRPAPAVEQLRGPLARLATYRVLRTLLAPWLVQRKVGWIASMSHDVGGDGPESRARVRLRDYIDNLRAMSVTAGQLGARTAYVALPAPIDLDPAGPPREVLEYRAAMQVVAAETAAPFIDGPDWFRRRGATIGFFDDQVHPNRYGHALLGVAIADALAQAHP